MLAFVDESGDTGLKLGKGSSRYFAVALILFEERADAEALDKAIGELRRTLSLKAGYEFHFAHSSKRIKDAFFELLPNYDFLYFGIVVNKRKLTGPGFRFASSFYKFAVSIPFRNAEPYLSDTVVVFDGRGSRKFKRELKAYLRKKMNQTGGRKIAKVKIQDSDKNNLLQVADMVCGAIMHSFRPHRRGGADYRTLIEHREVKVQFWPKKNSPNPSRLAARNPCRAQFGFGAVPSQLSAMCQAVSSENPVYLCAMDPDILRHTTALSPLLHPSAPSEPAYRRADTRALSELPIYCRPA